MNLLPYVTATNKIVEAAGLMKWRPQSSFAPQEKKIFRVTGFSGSQVVTQEHSPKYYLMPLHNACQK
jgi:hypothetical protein